MIGAVVECAALAVLAVVAVLWAGQRSYDRGWREHAERPHGRVQ